jgi:hypothetical protein
MRRHSALGYGARAASPKTEAVIPTPGGGERRVTYLGSADDVTTCDNCGKSELKGTVTLSIDGGEPVYYGSDCAARALGTKTKDVLSATRAADRARDAAEARVRDLAQKANGAPWFAFLAERGKGNDVFTRIQSLGGHTKAAELYKASGQEPERSFIGALLSKLRGKLRPEDPQKLEVERIAADLRRAGHEDDVRVPANVAKQLASAGVAYDMDSVSLASHAAEHRIKLTDAGRTLLQLPPAAAATAPSKAATPPPVKLVPAALKLLADGAWHDVTEEPLARLSPQEWMTFTDVGHLEFSDPHGKTSRTGRVRREASSTSAHAVGFTWPSPHGERRIESIGPHPITGRSTYAVSTAGAPQLQLLPEDEIASEIRRDTANAASRTKIKVEAEEAKAADTEHARWGGFTDNMTPVQRARVDAILSKQVSVRGKLSPRGHHLENLVREGFRVNGGRLEGPDGSFFPESALTKIGFDYAQFLAQPAP